MDAHTIRDLRVESLRYLYGRANVAMSPAAIHRAVRKAGIDCTEDELVAQLRILASQETAQEVSDPDMPAVKAWQITGAGISHFEKHHA